jgi:hypothetical protein
VGCLRVLPFRERRIESGVRSRETPASVARWEERDECAGSESPLARDASRHEVHRESTRFPR